MNVDEDELIGEPIEDVPEQPAGYDCNARKSSDGRFQGYCGARAGKGTDHVGEGRCSNHGGASDGAPKGNENGQKHGAFKEHFRSDLTENEAEAIDDLVDHLTDIDDERAIAAMTAAEALMKYKRSADSRFLREARQWFSEFNLIPNSDEVELSGGLENEVSVDAALQVGWNTVEDSDE